jgi:hypothetical protein
MSAVRRKAHGIFSERLLETLEVEAATLRRWTRRDLLPLGAGAVATFGFGGSQLPQPFLERLGLGRGRRTEPDHKWLLNKALQFDDDVAELLYSPNRLVPTYTKSQVTFLKNNYNGATPDPGYVPGWRLNLAGLSSGRTVSLDINTLLTRFPICDQNATHYAPWA